MTESTTKSVLDLMTPEQVVRAGQPMAMSQTKILTFGMGEHPIRQTGHFHQVMQIATPDSPIVPSVSSREQRLRFILEEFLELCEACGFELVGEGEPRLEHIEGSRYDVVEAADALSDLNVVVNGTGVEWGLPLHVTDYEVYCSNLSKLDAEGNPVKNGVTPGYRDGSAVGEEPAHTRESGYRPDLPIGKILKPEGFIKANIPAALLAYERQEF